MIPQKYDLIIVGGGFAGTAAAIAAGRRGLSVLLIEEGGALGGAAVNCLVNPFMPWWTHEVKDGKKERVDLSRGIFTEIVSELKHFGAINGSSFSQEYLKIILDRMTASAGVLVLFHATLCGTRIKNKKISGISAITKSGVMDFEADTYIDSTGDASFAAMAKCPFHLGRESDHLCQPMTLCFRIVNVKTDKIDWDAINKKYSELQKSGDIKNPREDVLLFFMPEKNVIHVNSTRVVKLNPVDPFDLSKAEAIAREQMLELYNFLRGYSESFRDSSISVSGPSIGIRESRMIDGRHLLTSEELKDCVKFDDAIAAGNYDIDIHSPDGSGTSHYYFHDGEYYTIPYGTLIPVGVNNMLVAGRCISTTHEAQASIRIMPIVCTLGEAAGTAAAVAKSSKTAVAFVDVHAVQSELVKAGAFIG